MKAIHTSGKRKTAIARATLFPEGKGIIRVNGLELSKFNPQELRLRIEEPLILAGDTSKSVDIMVQVQGGGPASQADASRLTIGRALAQYNKKLEQVFLDYDRNLLVADVRLKETHKPNCHGKARSKRQKSYR